MQHTDMNWHKAHNSGNGQGLIIAENGDNVAVCYDEKDAPLIAAAPELLEALKVLSNFAYDHIAGYTKKEGEEAIRVYHLAQDAISKATSED